MSDQVPKKSLENLDQGDFILWMDRHLSIFGNLLDVVLVVDEDGSIKYQSASVEPILAYQPGRLLGKSIYSLLADKDSALMRSLLTQASAHLAVGLQANSLIAHELCWRTGAGAWSVMEVTINNLLAEPTIKGLMLHARDITKYQVIKTPDSSSRRAIGDNDEHYRIITETASDAIITIDDNCEIIFANHATEKLFGYQHQELTGKKLAILMPYNNLSEAETGKAAEFDKSRLVGRNLELTGRHMDGSEIPLEISAAEFAKNNATFFTVIIRDITERKQAQEKIREQAALLDITQDAIMVSDLKGAILFWNKGAERLYGWSSTEIIGQSNYELLYPPEATDYKEALNQTFALGEWSGELKYLHKDGKDIIVESRWVLVCDEKGCSKSILSVGTDITSKRELQLQFLHSQRLESIGTLAGGIAHNFNNMLAPILMSVQMLKKDAHDKRSQQLLELLETTAHRASDLVKQILSFARGVEGERVLLQPAEIIFKIKRLINESFDKSIELVIDLPDDIWPIYGDATQLQQVLMNLCVNARDAMPKGGKLTISVSNFYVDKNYARMHNSAQFGPYIIITITDTGNGIPETMMDRIFDPFFARKTSQKGAGLGLSTSMGIVKSHGGFIEVSSTLMKGTRFKIYLPVVQTDEITQKIADSSSLLCGHNELILVVDDEAPIRYITKETLESYGYRVVTAEDGVEAIAIYVEKKDEISAIITDMMMPVMDGHSLIRALQSVNLQTKIIAISGLASNEFTVRKEASVKAFLPKPYTTEELLSTLHMVLHPQE